MNDSNRILLVGAGGVTTRSVARALRERSVSTTLHLVGVDSDPLSLALHNGTYDAAEIVPAVSSPDYWSAIQEIVARHELSSGLIVPEREVLAWSQRVDRPVPVAIPPACFAELAGSKSDLYDALGNTSLVPEHQILPKSDLAAAIEDGRVSTPTWIRPHHFSASSGLGALRVSDAIEAAAWVTLNPSVKSWQVSAYVEGRNLAVSILFKEGKALRTAMYERLEYFMSRVAPSGITGNISRGRLTFDPHVHQQALDAFQIIGNKAGAPAHGLLTMDLLVQPDGSIAVTEINVRPTACVGLFTAAGFDIVGDWLKLALGDSLGSPRIGRFPSGNLFFRDIDAAPVWLPEGPAQTPRTLGIEDPQ